MRDDEDIPSLRLHMNLLFILMFGDREPEIKDSVRKVKSVLESILNTLQPKVE